MALEKRYLKPTKLIKCATMSIKKYQSIKSPHSQFVWSNMNDGIFYTLDGVGYT